MSKRPLAEADKKTGVWKKCFSKTYSREYWFNTQDGTKSWEDPANLPTKSGTDNTEMQPNDTPSNKYPKLEVGTFKDNKARNHTSTGTSSTRSTKVAIIVPFRDLQKEQNRGKQMNRFVPEMTAYMKSSGVPFHIYIVEQSDDQRKFNRGKLLNIGYTIAKKDNCSSFIFHDVDLLPSFELLSYYSERPEGNPVHIARVWDRYSGNPKYFGGVVSFSDDMFELINGFPNNFWGWGGEDDEMYNRTVKVGLIPTAPSTGKLTDMEDMSLADKLSYLKSNKVLKCMNKIEVLNEHETTWQTNGLNSLQYEELSRETLNPHASRVTVDVQKNNHWTDERCGIDDKQY